MNFRKYSGYIGVGSLLLGMIIGAIGWIKNESTIAADTKGAITLIVSGVTMIIGGLVVIFFFAKGVRK